MSYLELDLLPTKSEINPSDSFIVDSSGGLNIINSSSIDSTNFENGFNFSGDIGPVDIKFYFSTVLLTVDPTFSGITIGDGADSVFLSRTENLGVENAISIPKRYTITLGSESVIVPLLSSGDDSLSYRGSIFNGFVFPTYISPTTSVNGNTSAFLTWDNNTRIPSIGLIVR